MGTRTFESASICKLVIRAMNSSEIIAKLITNQLFAVPAGLRAVANLLDFTLEYSHGFIGLRQRMAGRT